MLLQRYCSTDLPQITELFHNTIHIINPKDYTQEQLDAWAPANKQFDTWDKVFQDQYTIVAYLNQTLIGFGNIDYSGYLDKLYTHHHFQNQGIASAICYELEKHIVSNKIKKITTHSSITAKIFFEKRNYRIIKEQLTERNGVLLKNYLMEKSIH